MSQHCWSPLVQVRHTPVSVRSHRHSPMVRLQVHTVMPLSMTQQLHMPPASMVHRVCTMLHASLSSVVQVIRRPPWHFSTRNVQRGTIVQLVPADRPVGAPTGDLAKPETPSTD